MDIGLIYLIFSVLFVIGYFLIATEHITHINKTGVSILLAGVLWFLAALFSHDKSEITHSIHEGSAEIFGIVVFLLLAMTIVELLAHYQFFDWLEEKIIEKQLSSKTLFFFLGLITFYMSALLDNLTTTLIMIQIGRKLYKNKENFLLFVGNTIVAANAGGAWSPLGDVTTIMLWLAEKFNAPQIIKIGLIPSMVAWIIPQYLIGRQIKKETESKTHKDFVDADKVKPFWSVIIMGLLSFVLPVVFNIIGLPPFLGLLLGLGVLWIFIDIKAKQGHKDHYLSGKVIDVIKKTDITTLKFFIGILLAVGALSYIGLLKELNIFIFGEDINMKRLILGSIVLGLASSILDNVPLVSACINMFDLAVPVSIWVFLAIMAGTGGSMLVIGSAAGVAGMGEVKELTFTYYVKNISIPALLGFIGAIGAWILMNPVLHLFD